MILCRRQAIKMAIYWDRYPMVAVIGNGGEAKAVLEYGEEV